MSTARPGRATKVAVVTGAGSGIGAAVARKQASDGFAAVLVGRRVSRLETVAADIEALGGSATVLAADVGTPEDAARVLEEACSLFGGIDLLVNNAGVLPPGQTVVDVALEDWDATVRTNLTGVFLMTRAALPSLLARKGAIVTIGSVSSVMGGPGSAAYSCTKAAAMMFTQCVAIDYGRLGLRANCVLPGWVQTEMADGDIDVLAAEKGISREAAYALATRSVPMQRPATPAEVAEVVAFLASPAASYVNGVALPVDGGSLTVWPGVAEFMPPVS